MPIWSAEIKKLPSFILLVVFIHAFSIHTLKGDDLINSYDIYLEINPDNQSITAEIKLDLNPSNSGIDILVFFLHKELSIASIESGHSLSYDFLKDEECPYFYMKNARPLKIILQLYNDWFPSKGGQYTIVLVPPFPNRGSYFRKGFVALLQPEPGSESAITTFKLLAHEFAHEWWSGANTNNWEDWLNESFAEYSCLMAIREKYGNEIFNDWINYKAYSSKFAEPVIGHDHNIRTSYSTRYDKGPVALNYLENMLGKEKFIEVLKEINEYRITTTDELLKKLEELTSGEIRELFVEELKK